jgi:segregation and condensation protein B
MTEGTFTGRPTVRQILEALFFATDEPLTIRQVLDIFEALEGGGEAGRLTPDQVLRLIDDLNAEYGETDRAFRVVKVAGGYQFATRPEFGAWLGAMVRERARRKLSVSALESLAVIAYKQPVTKPEIEAIRGVNADYVLRTLLERNLISIVGRAATPGRPLLYGTTRDFLKHFGLNDLAELPKPREIDELLAEAQFEVEKRRLAELERKRSEEENGEEGLVSKDLLSPEGSDTEGNGTEGRDVEGHADGAHGGVESGTDMPAAATEGTEGPGIVRLSGEPAGEDRASREREDRPDGLRGRGPADGAVDRTPRGGEAG